MRILNVKASSFDASPCCSSGSSCSQSGRSQWTWTALTRSHGFQEVQEDQVLEEDRLVALSLEASVETLVALQEEGEEESTGARAAPLACTLREDTDPEGAVGPIVPLLQKGRSCFAVFHTFHLLGYVGLFLFIINFFSTLHPNMCSTVYQQSKTIDTACLSFIALLLLGIASIHFYAFRRCLLRECWQVCLLSFLFPSSFTFSHMVKFHLSCDWITYWPFKFKGYLLESLRGGTQ